MFKSGFVSIIGRPNVGKSTLLNQIVGEKIAIMTNKPQTTRNRINAIYQDKEAQIVFIDTPGIHKPKHKLGEFMTKQAVDTLNEVDVVIYMVDDSKSIGPGDQFILNILESVKSPIYVLINKMDIMDQEAVQHIYDQYAAYPFIKQVMGISALGGHQVSGVVAAIKSELKEGPAYYPDDILTDMPERDIVSEIIREKLLMYLDDEIPHGVAVEVESMTARAGSDLMDIHCAIVCEKKSHKGIIIGKEGRKLKGIGQASRKDIEKFLNKRVNLQLWVKIKEGWRDDATALRSFGYKEK